MSSEIKISPEMLRAAPFERAVGNGWWEKKTGKSGQCYYTHEITGESQWPRPVGLPCALITEKQSSPLQSDSCLAAGTDIVQEWIREHGSEDRSDMHLVVQEGGVETRIPVSRDVLRITSGLMRGLPEAGDMPVLGEHAASTVVKFTRLCYPSFKAPPKFSLEEISTLVRLAHWFDAPPVIELLHDQFKTTFDTLPTLCADFIPGDQHELSLNTAPEPDLYAALFSMKNAGKHIELSPHLALHFPAWFIKLDEKERARFNKYAQPTFLDFIAQCGALKDVDLAHAGSGNVLTKSSELLLQLSRFLVESYRTYDSDDSDDDEPRPKRPRPSEDSSA